MDKKRKTDDNSSIQFEENDFSLSSAFFEELNTVTVESLKTSGNKIFICTREDKIVDVWKGLSDHSFSSVPVLQKTKNRYYGVVDMHDIIHFILTYMGKEKLDKIENFWKSIDKFEKLKSITVNSVMQYPNTLSNPFHPVTVGYSLHFALELFAKEENLDRIPIITRDRSLYNMLTVSRVVQFFHDNKRILGKRLNKPISLIGASTSGVHSVKESDQALVAFNMMNDLNVSAVAVLNDEGKLSGVISQTDLKVISPDGSLFYKLYQDSKSFVDSVNMLKESSQVVTVTKSDTFERVLDLLHLHKIHRIFVVNDENKPAGIISLKDLIRDIILF